MMMAENPKITVEVEAKGVPSVRQQMGDLHKVLERIAGDTTLTALRMQKMTEATKKAGDASNKAKNEISDLSKTFNALKNAVVAYFSIDMGKQIIQQADSFRLLEQRLMLITKNQDEYNNSLKSVLKTSNALGVNLKVSSKIFQRFAIELSRMGKGNDELIKFYETTLALGSVGSSSIDSMNDALIQLGQSLSGRVQADEFRSISEQAPLIAIALKEYLKVSTSELKEMFKDGEVYSTDLYNAIMSKGKEVEKIYANLPISVGRSFQGLQNTFAVTFAELDKQTGISTTIINGLNGVAKGLQWVGQNLDTVKTITVLTTVAVASLALALNMTSIVTSVSKALQAMSTVLATTRLGVIAMSIAMNPLYGILTLLATTGIVLFTNNMIKGFSATRNAVYKATGGMISDLDILGAKLAGLGATWTTFWSNIGKSSGKKNFIFKDGQIVDKSTGKTPNPFPTSFDLAKKAGEKAEKESLNRAGKRASASEMLRGLAISNVEATVSPFSKPPKGNKKSGSTKSQAEQELDRYKDALKTLKDKAREAMLEVQGMDKAINALASGGIKAYEAQVKQNEGLGRYNELMGDYLGKGKQELELIAQRIVKQEQDAEAKKKQLELSVQLAEAQRAINIEENTAKQLRDAFLNGGLAEYELKKRQIEIEERKRTLLGDGNATEEQKKQAQQIAEQEDRIAQSKTLLEQQVEDAKQASESIRNALRSAFDNTIEHMVNGTTTFKEVMVGLLRQIAVQLIKVYTLQLLMGVIGRGQTGGADAGAFGGGLTGIFDKLGTTFKVPVITANPTTGRATGGAVSANVPYVVGEAGREMFVPRSAGNIIPNYAMSKGGGGGAITVVNNMTINTQEGDDKNSIMEAGKALSAMMETKVRQILQVESRQGGMLHRSFA